MSRRKRKPRKEPPLPRPPSLYEVCAEEFKQQMRPYIKAILEARKKLGYK